VKGIAPRDAICSAKVLDVDCLRAKLIKTTGKSLEDVCVQEKLQDVTITEVVSTKDAPLLAMVELVQEYVTCWSSGVVTVIDVTGVGETEGQG